ncbi:uncharacterized protein BXZ73DRAFT_90725 [Epithele typhae]|uniref:uncharacterized protein n=1 Tax=Epithele typhae TaxID=378194 RepID=UPI0020088AD9|nr:uncharacterized protein BXZ73DRAFT_90725 [Epithele typhae]KAH9927449.1 hypothetical protein BXZ73DRAFT_90725 [Epithele typhae]
MDTDSEDDSDYVPPTDKGGSDGEAPAPKRARTEDHKDQAALNSEREQANDGAYTAFKASLNASPEDHAHVPVSAEMVKITKRYRYAGEEVIEVKEVPANSDDAKKWPHWTPSDIPTIPSSAVPATSDTGTLSAPSTSTATAGAPATKPSGKRPGPRKGKTKLGEIPKKEPIRRLTTLDKSAMDWRAHVEGEESAEMKDELEANRRGGGYLEKVEFLQRVEARKEEVLDASKGKRRR